MEIRFLEIAERELDEAVTYYNVESPGLGDEFLLQFLNALERIRQYSEAWKASARTPAVAGSIGSRGA